MTTLIVGIGNTLRGDDGIAARVLELLSASPTQGVELRCVHSLVPELSAEVSSFEQVVFVDADVSVHRVSLAQVDEDEGAGLHSFSPATIVGYSRQLGFRGEAYVCRLPVWSLGVGEGLSPDAAHLAELTAETLAQLVNSSARERR